MHGKPFEPEGSFDTGGGFGECCSRLSGVSGDEIKAISGSDSGVLAEVSERTGLPAEAVKDLVQTRCLVDEVLLRFANP